MCYVKEGGKGNHKKKENPFFFLTRQNNESECRHQLGHIVLLLANVRMNAQQQTAPTTAGSVERRVRITRSAGQEIPRWLMA